MISKEDDSSKADLPDKSLAEDITKSGSSDYKDETEATSIPEELTRDELYEKGDAFYREKKYDVALKNFLECIKGLEKDTKFSYLPQCLRKIAEIYHIQSEDEKAVHFLKAEKIYYENALIDTSTIQNKIEELSAGGDKSEEESKSVDTDMLRAVEYDNLSLLCQQKNQTQLALEFSGKAAKLYQQLLGDEHEKTQNSLDLFTNLYAEVGKEDYQAKLEQFNKSPELVTDQSQQAGADGVRKRNGNVQTADSATETIPAQTQPAVPQYSAISWIEDLPVKYLYTALLICLIVVSVLFTFSYCRMTKSSYMCSSIRKSMKSMSEQLQYLLYRVIKLVPNVFKK